MKKLWDSVSSNGRNRIQVWARKTAHLSAKDRAALNHRFYMLEQLDYDLAVGTKVLNGPLRGSKGIYKLKAFADHAMRPMLCRGPVDAATEYTILEGATEPNFGILVPPDAEARAAKTKDYIEQDPPNRRLRHESF